MEMIQEPLWNGNPVQYHRPTSTQTQQCHELTMDQEITSLDKALHDLEFETQHSIKLANKRKERLELLHQKLADSKTQTSQHKTNASQRDDQCKQMHRQFIRNNELTKTFLSTITPLVENQLKEQKDIEISASEFENFKKKYNKLLEHYQHILRERKEFYTTFPGMEKLIPAKKERDVKCADVEALEREQSELQRQIKVLLNELEGLPDFLKSKKAFVLKLAALKLSTSAELKESENLELAINDHKEKIAQKSIVATLPGAPSVSSENSLTLITSSTDTSNPVQTTFPDQCQSLQVSAAQPAAPLNLLQTTGSANTPFTMSHYFSRSEPTTAGTRSATVAGNLCGSLEPPPPPPKLRQLPISCPVPSKQPKLDFGLEFQFPTLNVPTITTSIEAPRTPKSVAATRNAPRTPVRQLSAPVLSSPVPQIGANEESNFILPITTPRTLKLPVISEPEPLKFGTAAPPKHLLTMSSVPTSEMEQRPTTSNTTLVIPSTSACGNTRSASGIHKPAHGQVSEPQFKVPLPPDSRPMHHFSNMEVLDHYRQETNFAERESRRADSPSKFSETDSTTSAFAFSSGESAFSGFGSGEPDVFSFDNKDQGFGVFGEESGGDDFGFSFGNNSKSPSKSSFGFFGGGDTDDNGPMSFF